MYVAEWVTGEVTLSVNGAPLNLRLTVPAAPVKPQVMLPIFQKLANAFTDFATSRAEASGTTISCQKGCGHCCRQPIPLTEVEVYYIAMLLDSLPEPRRTEVKARFEAAAAHFQANGWFAQFEACNDESALKAANRAYFFEGIACPFLEEESCSIYTQRPIICREFLVSSPPQVCADDLQDDMVQIPLPVQASGGASRMATSGRLGSKGFLPMVFAPGWVAKYPEDFPEKTGSEWLAEFFG